MMVKSDAQQVFESFCLGDEFLGADSDQLAEVVELQADAGQPGKVRNLWTVPFRLVADI